MEKSEVLNNIEQVKKWIEEAETQPKKEEKTIGIAIRNRWTGSIIFQSTKTTYQEAVREAINTDANLTNANLTGANLTGCKYYMGFGNRNFEALCRAIKTIKHNDGTFDQLSK